MRIFPIVVVYRADFRQTNAHSSLLSGFQGGSYLIYDNSPEPQNQRYATPGTIYYYHDASNGGVSAAYNYGARLAESIGGVDALLLLDHDTCFQKDYITKLEEALEAFPKVDLFVPQVVYQGDRPFSPVNRGRGRRQGVNLPAGCYSLNDFLPVNSGACIRLSAFKRAGGYNSAIRLDFADFDFFSRLAAVTDKFCVLDSVAHQSFSNEEACTDKLWQRYQFYLEGAKIAHRNPLIRRMVEVDALRHACALAWRTRNLKFLTGLFRIVR